MCILRCKCVQQCICAHFCLNLWFVEISMKRYVVRTADLSVFSDIKHPAIRDCTDLLYDTTGLNKSTQILRKIQQIFIQIQNPPQLQTKLGQHNLCNNIAQCFTHTNHSQLYTQYADLSNKFSSNNGVCCTHYSSTENMYGICVISKQTV